MNSDRIDFVVSLIQRAKEAGVIDEEFYENINERIRSHELRITVVGEFSSGKSTLLDAIVGKDILPHSSSETTATLTYIHSVEKGDDLENLANITFVNGESKTVPFDELKEYVTAFSNSVNVFSQIDHVDVYTHIENLESNIVLIDTPGLNGTNHFEDKTLMEISRADASIFVFSPSGIKSSELSFMREDLIKHQSSFFYVMNRIDDIKESEGDTLESKISDLTNQISELFFNKTIIPQTVVGVSSLKALAAKDLTIKRLYLDDLYEIADEDRQKLWEASNFENFLNMLKTYLREEKENVFVNSLLSQISYVLDEGLREINQGMEACVPKAELPEAAIIREEISTSSYRFKNYEKTLSKNINAKMDDAERLLESLLSGAVKEGKDKLEEERKHIDSINSIEEFDRIFGEDGSKANNIVTSFYERTYEKINRNITDKINDIEGELVKEIKSMIPDISSLKKRDLDNISIGQKSYEGIAAIDTSRNNEIIKGMQEDIQRLNKKISDKRQEKAAVDQKIGNLLSQQNRINSDMTSVDRKIQSLGRRPSVRYTEVTKTRTYEVKDNGITNLWGLFKDRYKTVRESYQDIEEDSTERDNYDRKRKSLDSERNKLSCQLQTVRNQIQSLPDLADELRKLERDFERKQAEIEYQQKEVERAQFEYNQKRRQGEMAFLNSRKMELLKVLTDVLSFPQSNLHSSLKKDTLRFMKDCRENLETVIRSYFKKESERYIAHLESMLNTLESTITDSELKRKRDSLCANKMAIEKFSEEIKSIL